MSSLMMCLVEQEDSGGIVGWVVGVDAHDVRRRMPETDRYATIAQKLYAREFWPAGKHYLGDGFFLLVG